MKLQFLGGTGTVTGSKYRVDCGAASVLVDCGLFQGYKPLRLRNWAPAPFDPAALSAIVLTHAHIDHSGYLPLVARMGYRGKVFCTAGTADLCRVLLPDSAHLQEEEAENANRFGYSKHAPALPLYDRADAERALRLLEPVPYGIDFSPAPGVVARLDPAGHILGAASVRLRAQGRSLLFSGDVGRKKDAVMNAPSAPKAADMVVVEGTYGDRLHESVDAYATLGRIVSRTASRGGVVIIPAFAVGRAQALLLLLARLKSDGVVPASMPVYLDSPMAADVTELYLRHREEHRLDDEQCRRIREVAKFVASPEESKRLDESSWPMVIVAGSGMATGGRVLHHLKRFAPDPRNAIVFAGFQAGGTRGAALVQGAVEVKIHGAYVPVRAKVHHLEGLSAHADAIELVEWLRALRRPPARLFVTHAEPDAADALRRRIHESLGWNAEIPDYLETVELAAGTAAGASGARDSARIGTDSTP